MRIRLNEYSDRELAMFFDNTPSLYDARFLSWVETIELALSKFEFTDAQLEELKDWWDSYQEEE